MTDENKTGAKDSPFVTDEDTFDVKINYYKDNKKIVVEGTDGFDDKKEKSSIVFTIRYPSQADCELIMQRADSISRPGKELDVSTLLKMEAIRFMILVKAWNIDKELNNDNIMDLHPDIVRRTLIKIREEITTNGIF